MWPHPARGRVPGGNPPLRPDQAAQLGVTRAGSGPAPQQDFITQRVVVFGTGPGRGVFVYSPTPGAGSLVDSIASAAGTDPFGNAYLAGMTNYTLIGATHVAVETSGGTISFLTAASAAGPYTLVNNFSLFGAGPGPALQVQGDLVAVGGVFAEAGVASSTPPSGAEVFNDLGSTGLAGDAGSASYKLTPEGELQITVQKTFTALGGVTTATFATTLVAPYIPTAARILVGDPIKVNGGSPGSTTGLHLTTGGAVQLTGLPAGATGAGCDVRIPLF